METDAVAQAAIHTRLRDIDPGAWDRCAGDDNPFICHAFLRALEESGSATAETGWLGQHILLTDDAGAPLAAMPLYLKSHSLGEYVFDHGWADAYGRAGGRYYPKLQCSVPFTPATGPRLLVPAGGDRTELRRALASAAITLAERHQVSSLHITFAEHEEAAAMSQLGLAIRTDQQFHWQNQGYGTFADFLDALTSRKRKTIRRERRDALAAGIEIETLTGNDITEDHWDHFFQFYMDTGGRKWGRPYLTRAFFSMIGESLAGRIVLIMAKRGGRYIAGALNLLGRDIIYGRHWG
ncbi:MAG: GNAT family N-acetyltransferase, partial [Sphingomonadales bacterium]|nr:GNAT family N-acetyltransferase [Sphingomonadales bacterium]